MLYRFYKAKVGIEIGINVSKSDIVVSKVLFLTFSHMDTTFSLADTLTNSETLRFVSSIKRDIYHEKSKIR